MEAFVNLSERFLNWLHRRFFRWRELKGLYESAIKGAKGNEALKQAAMKILRSDFFDDFVRQRTVKPEQEFSEFLRRMKESCPDADEVSITTFLESVYSELATLMEKHPSWDKRGDAIDEFLQNRRQTFEEAETAAPITEITYTSHFVNPPVAKNFLDREDELQTLRRWLEDQQRTVGALVGIGGQGKTYLAAKLAEECSQKGWQVRWMELPKTADEFLRSIAAEMQKGEDPSHSVVGNSNQPLNLRVNNAIRFLEEHKDRWLFVLDDFHKVGEDKEWQELIVELDRRCQRTKVLLTARREPDFPLKLPTGAHELQDVPPLPKAFAQAYL
ncbi:MAG: NB-ARC domain-containing protein, partial [Armatimonadota bacterium]|nr:NB-ARC domain-containing protein [Armatimonadota bacterium]